LSGAEVGEVEGGGGCGVLDLGQAGAGEGGEVVAAGVLGDDHAQLGVWEEGGWGIEGGEGGGEVVDGYTGEEPQEQGRGEVGVGGDGLGGGGVELGEEGEGEGGGDSVADFPELGEGEVVTRWGWGRLSGEVAEDGVDKWGGAAAGEAAALFDGLVDGDGGGDIVHAGELPGGQDEDLLDEFVDGVERLAGVVGNAVAQGEEGLDAADVQDFDEGGVAGGGFGVGWRAGDEVGTPAGEASAVEAEQGEVAGGGGARRVMGH